MPKLRSLKFQSLDEIVAEADRLLATGYTRGGKWSLGQNCDHIAAFMEHTVKGFPFTLPRFVQRMVRWAFWKTIAEDKSMSMQMPAPAAFVPGDVADAAGVERLRAAVAALKNPPGPLHPSPVFGPLTDAEWLTVHLWHAGHHLGHLAPTVAAASSTAASPPDAANASSAANA